MVPIQFPARIHVLLASQAPVGVVIRRGPAKRVATILWDRTRDEFKMGQWLKGRIYERLCDLSPDGKYFLYSAGKAGTSWTGVSHAPFLKAISMYLIGGECWLGGGVWTSETTYLLNSGQRHTIRGSREVVASNQKEPPPVVDCVQDLSRYAPRLIRDGWNVTRVENIGTWQAEQTFEKQISPEWMLRKLAHPGSVGKGCYWEEHQLVHPTSGVSIAYPDWEWADLDGTRLVWATGGKLFTGSVLAEGLANETLLFDFNGMLFTPIEAPY